MQQPCSVFRISGQAPKCSSYSSARRHRLMFATTKRRTPIGSRRSNLVGRTSATNFESLMTGVPVKEDLVRDGWTEAFRLLFGNLREKAPSKWRLAAWSLGGLLSKEFYQKGIKQYLTDKATAHMDLTRQMELADFAKMEKIRSRADSIVEDQETAEALKPYYRQFCKRPCFHDEYLSTYNRPNVHLIDTDGRGVDEFTEKGVMFDGKEYEVDCIIFATGFEVGTDYSRRAGYSIIGVNEMSISEKWSNGLSTYHGMHSRGFPIASSLGLRNRRSRRLTPFH